MTKLEEIARSIYMTELPDGDPLCVALENAADEFGCETAEQMREWIAALTVKAARNVIDALMTPSEAMINAANGALKAHIDALPQDVRAKSKDKGGVIFVGPTEKHAIRFRAMLRAVLDEKPETK